ncbi:MAG: hypothetical protein HWD85_07040 [Flavobacteriaceae bacterium]|nr:hypothetical protein [Flavobacteriaceae bacterium]
MDLDKLKDSWKKQEVEQTSISKEDIYKMTHSKSSSIVKWIFIIGVAEFVFWILLNFIVSRLEMMEVYNELNLMKFLDIVYYINLFVVVAFLYYFYKNYSSISTIDTTKNLMNNIIKTRRTVKYYVNYNVLGSLLLMIIFNIKIINTPNGIETMLALDNTTLDSSNLLTAYVIGQAIGIVIMLLLLFGFYYLLYGRLLRKLKKNHKELDNIEHLS